MAALNFSEPSESDIPHLNDLLDMVEEDPPKQPIKSTNWEIILSGYTSMTKDATLKITTAQKSYIRLLRVERIVEDFASELVDDKIEDISRIRAGQMISWLKDQPFVSKLSGVKRAVSEEKQLKEEFAEGILLVRDKDGKLHTYSLETTQLSAGDGLGVGSFNSGMELRADTSAPEDYDEVVQKVLRWLG